MRVILEIWRYIKLVRKTVFFTTFKLVSSGQCPCACWEDAWEGSKPPLLTWFNLNQSMDKQLHPSKVWDDFICPLPNFNACVVYIRQNVTIPLIINGSGNFSRPCWMLCGIPLSVTVWWVTVRPIVGIEWWIRIGSDDGFSLSVRLIAFVLVWFGDVLDGFSRWKTTLNRYIDSGTFIRHISTIANMILSYIILRRYLLVGG